MTTLATIRLAIAEGKLRPDEESLAHDIITKHGEEVFRYFLLHREKMVQEAQLQAEINRKLGVSAETFAKYNQ